MSVAKIDEVRAQRPAAQPAQRPAAQPTQRSASAVSRSGLSSRLARLWDLGDVWLAGTVLTLMAFGVVMVYSASAVGAAKYVGDSTHYFVRQAIFACVGAAVMFGCAQVPPKLWRRLSKPALIVCVLMLLAVLLGLGRKAGGAARWIAVGPVNLQPAEAAKLALVLWLAASLSKKRADIRTFRIGFLPHALVAGVVMLLCLKQPDFGSAVVIAALTFILLLSAGARLGYLMLALLAALPVAWALVASSPYRMRRIQAFLEPFEHRYGAGYQVAESLMSFGAGGVTGVGLGDGKQKLLFLPEAHTDFISAIVGEELGMLGVWTLIGAYAFLAFRGLRLAFFAKSEFGALLCVGATSLLILQGYTNLAVAMGLVPTKGLVLPFISYGGSALLVDCAAVGVMLAVARDGRRPTVAPRPRRVRSSNAVRPVGELTPS